MDKKTSREAFEAWRETQPWYIVCKGEDPAALMNVAAWTAWQAATLTEREHCCAVLQGSADLCETGGVAHTMLLASIGAIRKGETP